MASRIVTLRNDFHGTECRIRVGSLPARLSTSQIARCRRTLCGIEGCTCGGLLGQRGHQDVQIELSGGEYPGHIMLRALGR